MKIRKGEFSITVVEGLMGKLGKKKEENKGFEGAFLLH